MEKNFESFKNVLFEGDIDAIKSHLKTEFLHCIVDDNKKLTPIAFACEKGQTEIVKLFIDQKCDIECDNKNKCKPIHSACALGYIDIVKLLLDNGCNIECENKDKARPIHSACRHGFTDITRLLIEKNCDIDCAAINNRRPIHIACAKGHLDVVKILIENNCDVECKDKDNKTPLDLAKENNHSNCAYLIENFLKISCYINKNNSDGFIKIYDALISAGQQDKMSSAALDIVIKNRINDIVNFMKLRKIDDRELIYFNDVFKEVDKYPETLKENILYRCIKDNHFDGFYEFCSSSVVNKTFNMKCSFLEVAAEYGRTAFVNKILKCTIYDKEKWNLAKAKAVENANYKIAEDISDREFIIITRSEKHFSILHTAVCDNNVDMVKYILDNNKVDANVNHHIFGTALALAHSLAHRKCIRVLESYKVDTNTQNKFLQTPLHEAIASGTHEHLTYLMENGDDIDRIGFNNLTALHYAVIMGYQEVCADLIRYKADCTKYTLLSDPLEISKTADSNVILSAKENALTLCLKFHKTIYPCFYEVFGVTALNCVDASGNTLIHLATAYLILDVCEFLLKAGAFVNRQNNDGNSCLLELFSTIDISFANENIDLVIEMTDLLLKNGADINMESNDGKSVLECASRLNNEKLMVAMMKYFNEINNLKKVLKLIFKKKWFTCGEMLIKELNNKKLSLIISKQVLEISLQSKKIELLKRLYEKANVNVKQHVLQIILSEALNIEDVSLFDYFIEKEIYVVKNSENESNLLFDAIEAKKTEFCLKLLRSINAENYANTVNKDHQLPLQLAIEREELDVVECLISITKNFDHEDQYGNTSLMQLLKKISSCKNKQTQLRLFQAIQLIIKKGGNIYLTTSRNERVIDSCSCLETKTVIEEFYKGHAERPDIN